MAKLTPKQQRFVEEYLVDLNATQAAIRAGYSKKTAKATGHENLTKPDIAKAVEAGRKAMAEKAGVSAERVVNELALIGFADMGKFVTVHDDGAVVIDFSKLATGDLRACSEISQKHIPTKDGPDIVETKFKLHSKVQALKQLGDHLGIFKAPEQQVTGEFIIDLSGANDA